MPRVVAVVQARMTSTRLPGKVLAPIGDRPMLGWVLRATIASRHIAETVLATTTNATDAPLVELAARYGVAVFRGPEVDVLDRFRGAVVGHDCTHVVRLTGDCPFLDPRLIDETIELCLREDTEYASNGLEPGFPRGLDVEVMTREALETTWREATLPHDRSHVTSYLYAPPGRFRLSSLTPERVVDQRWTVDTREDLAFAQAIAARLSGDGPPMWEDVAAMVEQHPELRAINAHCEQKPLVDG